MIEQTWAQVTARPGVQLFDGPMCRMESFSASDEALRLVLSRTSYKPFLGTNLHHCDLADRYGPQILANPVGVSPALISRDNYLLLGRRNASVAYYPNRVHPFSGSLEPRESLDVFAEVRRELSEELHLGPDEITDLRCTGLVEDCSLRQPELVFRATCALDRAAIEARLDKTEHDAIWAIPATASALEEVFARPALLTPVALASLLLWARTALDPAWFAARLRQVTAT